MNPLHWDWVFIVSAILFIVLMRHDRRHYQPKSPEPPKKHSVAPRQPVPKPEVPRVVTPPPAPPQTPVVNQVAPMSERERRRAEYLEWKANCEACDRMYRKSWERRRQLAAAN